MGSKRDITTQVTSCILLILFVYNTAASLHRAKFCQLYGLGGTADVESSDTLEQCNQKCLVQTMPPCQKALFYGGLGCCVYYSTRAVYDMACETLLINGFRALHVSGCEAREKPTLLMLQKITPPSVKTTPRVTTTTTKPPAEGDGEGQTTVSMTTEADLFPGFDDIPDPENPERCSEEVVTAVQPAWYQLQAKLRNQSAFYFCHKLCQGPLPPKYPWLKPTKSKGICKLWDSYDSSLCASFLDTIMRTWNEFKDGQLTLTLCSHPPLEDEFTTESSVTAGNVTEVAGGNVTDVTGADGGVTEGA